MTLIKSIHSELIKLKYPPILWLIGFVLFVCIAILFSAHYIDVQKTAMLGRNPWIKLDLAGQAVFSIFISIPFIVLFFSAAFHIEHNNRGFKQLYTFPQHRATLLLHKLATFLMTLFVAICILIIGTIGVGYFINAIYPETEFIYFEIPFFSMVKSYAYILISLLGVIGIQFFLSLRFKGFLVPASIGILGYVFGLIVSSVNNVSSLYFPYCYPIVSREKGMMDTSELNIDQSAILNNVELYSIAIFIIFVMLSLFSEHRRNI